jgi:leishmanolysin-like peptidase
VPADQGAANTDLYVFVTAEQTSHCPDPSAQSGTLAYAGSCQRDQFDRPIFGYINFCPYQVPSSSSSPRYPVAVSTAQHELTHVLGFNSQSWGLFRNASRAPLTPRDAVQPNQVAPEYMV